MNGQLSMNFAARVATARKLGAEAGEHALSANDPTFAPRAIEFIRTFARDMAPGQTIPGEELTRAMKTAGIVPVKDDRAFGPIFRTAEAKLHLLRIVGQVPRVRGHGARDGKLYAAGEGCGVAGPGDVTQGRTA